MGFDPPAQELISQHQTASQASPFLSNQKSFHLWRMGHARQAFERVMAAMSEV